MNLPQGLPPLPPVPEGFDRWIDRGTKWGAECATYASTPLDAKFAGEWVVHHDDPAHGSPVHHYIEAVREPAEPSAQLFATLDPNNVEEADQPSDDHKDCRDGCRYSHDLGDGMQRVCPYGECQRNNPRFPRAEPAKDQPASDPNNLEGNGRTIEEMAAATRELNRIAPTPADKFALMFGRIGHFQLGDHTQINKTETP